MIVQFVGGHLDGKRREVSDDPPWHIATMPPMPPIQFDFSADMSPVASMPDQVVYTRHTFGDRFGLRLFAYFCGVEPRSVVPIALVGQLFLTRPRDARRVAANVLAELFRRQMSWWGSSRAL